MKLQFQLPPQVTKAMELLGQGNFECFAVGGCVRDTLRGTTPHDWDLTTNAKPEQMQQCFAGYHTIETGLQHGTLTVMLDHMPLEITTYRIDGAYTDHRRPDQVSFTNSLTDDLARRDFTVNAMAYHPQCGLIDPFGGAEDLQRKCIACVGNPSERFDEDGLRILRALRFAAVLDFTIDPQTDAAIHHQKDLLKHISAERIFVEMTKMLCGQAAERLLLAYPDVICTVLPQLQPMVGFDQQNPYHAYDVYTHSCKVTAAAPATPVLRWAAFLHDSGKPHTFTRDERGGHFYGHGQVSEEIARRTLHQLKSDRKTLDAVVTLIRHHDTVFSGNAKQIKRMVNRIGDELTEQLILLHRADVSAQAEHLRAQRIQAADALLHTLMELRQQNACMTLKDLQINGKDIIAMGAHEGQIIGACLNAVMNDVLEEHLPNERNALLTAAKQYLQQM
ncbi:MAG: CCA tRNA nucleotidyltransferase [Oscillospiraceae bacterium]